VKTEFFQVVAMLFDWRQSNWSEM